MNRLQAFTLIADPAALAGFDMELWSKWMPCTVPPTAFKVSNPANAAGSAIKVNACKRFTVDHNILTRTNGTSTVTNLVEILVGCDHFIVANNISGGNTTGAVVNDTSGAVTKSLTANI